MIDLRYLIKTNGSMVLQFRTGTPQIVGNPRHDAWSDSAAHGKYTTKVKWGKWRDIRIETQQVNQNKPRVEAE